MSRDRGGAEQERVRLSRRLSLVLRHDPGSVGLALDPAGWVEVDDLLAALRGAGLDLTRADLDEVVRSSDKQRFALDPSGRRIRAQQGHSVEVDLGLEPQEPPTDLWHGTVARSLEAIRREGLLPRGRHHVHLSADRATALRVGARRGRPVLLHVDAAAMAAVGIEFRRSGNGVWLVDAVPPQYLREETDGRPG
jgi:putative RNA 2'-phosphotransferase